MIGRDGIDRRDEALYQIRSQKAEQAVREMGQEDSIKMHEKLDSGMSEDDQFSSVQRQTYNPPSARGIQNRNRGGRPRGGSNFQSGNDNFDSHNDGQFQRNAGSKRSEQGNCNKGLISILGSLILCCLFAKMRKSEF